jgi:hypothetical protein
MEMAELSPHIISVCCSDNTAHAILRISHRYHDETVNSLELRSINMRWPPIGPLSY